MGQKGATGTWGLPAFVEQAIQGLDPKVRDMARRQYLRMTDPSYYEMAAASGMANWFGPTMPWGYTPWLYGDEPKGYRDWTKREDMLPDMLAHKWLKMQEGKR